MGDNKKTKGDGEMKKDKAPKTDKAPKVKAPGMGGGKVKMPSVPGMEGKKKGFKI